MSSETAEGNVPSGTTGAGMRVVGPVVERAIMRRLSLVARDAPRGRLQVTLPSGAQVALGSGAGGASAQLLVKTYGMLWRMLLRGQLGFAESYIAGEIETDSLIDLFEYYMDNETELSGRAPSLAHSGWADRFLHHRRANTRSGSRRNIAAHYDLGNAFYRLWLDGDLNYSSGIYATEDATLEQAQAEKYERILSALGLAPHHDLLEIGCGWGGFAEAAARRGGRVTGITISRQQFEEASARLRRSGLTGRASIRFEDYRDTTGTFDRIASIEMIEAVGEANWPIYFRTVSDRLKPGGLAVIQAITIREDLFPAYRRNPDFIQRYIFPGGMLPTVAAMRRHAAAAHLDFATLGSFGPSYARTIADWRRRFDAAWPRIAALGFDRRFRRMWDYYLAYCEVGFSRGTIDVGLYRLAKGH